MKTPHIPLRSPDLSAPANVFKAHAPKKGYSRFISKGRRAACDTDIPVKRVKKVFVPKEREEKVFDGKTLKDGSFSQTRREKGRYIAPLVYDKTLVNKLF